MPSPRWWAVAAAVVACGSEGGPAPHVPSHVAGTVEGKELRYDALTRDEHELVIGTGQPFAMFRTDNGIEAYVLGADRNGEQPNTPQDIALGRLDSRKRARDLPRGRERDRDRVRRRAVREARQAERRGRPESVADPGPRSVEDGIR